MIKLNRIRNIFTLAILLSSLFGSCAEELASEREKRSSEWNRVLMDKYWTTSDLKGVTVTSVMNESRIGRKFKTGMGDDDEGKGLGSLALGLVLATYRFDDSAKENFEGKIKDCFRDVAKYIPTEANYPRISFLVLNHENEDNLHIANAGERVMVIRDGKIIFNSKNSGSLLNPIIHTHSVEEGDMILALDKGFQESDDAIVKMFLDDEVFFTILPDCKKKMAIVLQFVKQTESEQ